MPIITLTIKIDVPEGVTVEVAPEVETTPKVATMPTIVFSEEPEYPEVTKDNRRWTDDEDAVAADPELSDADVAELVERSIGAVGAYRIKRGYRLKTRGRELVPAPRSMARWTVSEMEYLMKEYPGDIHDPAVGPMAEKLGRSPGALHRKWAYLFNAQQDADARAKYDEENKED